MSRLRGSAKISLMAVVSTLELLLDFEDIDFIKQGIKGVISACTKEAEKFDKKSKPKTDEHNA